MFIGHYGIGFTAKKIDNKPSLATLFFASQFIDLLWPILLLLGLEKVEVDPGNTAFSPLNFVYYPFSHSAFGVLIWAVLVGVIYYLIKKNLKSSLLLAVLVMSHWVLDLLVHRPDLPILPWSQLKVGFGIWNSVILSVLLEGAVFIGGAYIYNKYTKEKNAKGKYGFWGLVIFLGVIYLMNIFGSPPPSAEAIAYVGFSQWLIVLWAYWIDKNRLPI